MALPYHERMTAPDQGLTASDLISRKIAELSGWRGVTLARMRQLILDSAPDIAEEWKWGTPVWSHGGILCTGEVYQRAVKLTFPKGAALTDPAGLFNASLEGKVRRAIDLHEADEVAPAAFQALIREAVGLNGVGRAKGAGKPRT